MEFNSVKREAREVSAAVVKRIYDLSTHSDFINGAPVRELEDELCGYVGAKCAAVSSGSDALILALRALGIGPGDVVLVPAFGFYSTAAAVFHVGATPFYVDVDTHTFCVSMDSLLMFDRWPEGVREKVKALIVVDLFGFTPDYNDVYLYCRRNHITIIEDAAQSMGCTCEGLKCGSLGDISITSFYPTKNLGCWGDGGAVFSRKSKLIEIVKKLRDHAQVYKYKHEGLGYNMRMDSIQAEVLLEKMKELFPAKIKGLPEIASSYVDAFARLDAVKGKIVLPKLPDWNNKSSMSMFPIVFNDEDDRGLVTVEFARRGIPYAIHYPKGLHEILPSLTTHHRPLWGTEYLCDRILQLPYHYWLHGSDIVKVVTAIRDVLTGENNE